MKCFAMSDPLRLSLTRGIRAVEQTALFILAFTCLVWTPSAEANDYERAHRLVVQQKWTEALPLLKALHEEAPGSTLVGTDLAQTLIRLNRREEALVLLKKYGLVKQASVVGRAFITQESYKLYQEGVNFLETRSYRQAKERFERALERDQAHFEILVRLAQSEILDGNADAGLKTLERVTKIYGTQPEVALWQGKAYSMKGQGERAVSLLRNAVRTLPTSEIAPIWLAETLYANGQKASAIVELEADLKKNPQHVQALLTLARLRLSAATGPAQVQEVQRDLQIAQSRMEKYASPKLARFESDLGVEMRDPEFTAKAYQLLSERLQERLKQQPAS